MQLIDGLKLKGRPAEIPDCTRDDLPQFFVEMGFKVGAEIGVYKGRYTERFCRKGLKMYGIDPWLVYQDNEKNIPGAQEPWNNAYDRSQRALAPYIDKGMCTLIKKSSMEAIADFEDGSLDFVYIDGNHEFKFVAEDIVEWTKKVRKGGIVSGHDYTLRSEAPNPYVIHVKYVVDAFTKAFSINNWYIKP